MKNIKQQKRAIVTGMLLLCTAMALAQTGIKLILNGKTASTRVKMIEGEAWVPVKDVAGALGQSVQKITGGFQIGEAGGANAVSGLMGKTGDTLFDGSWRFTLTGIKEATEYTDRYTVNRPVTRKAPAGKKLILADIVVKNGMTIKNYLNLRITPENLTSLADADGRSFPVVSYDLRTGSGQPFGGGGNWDYTEELLPGAKADIVAIFTVPEDYKPNDLVFTLAYPPKQFAQMKRTTLRVKLPQP
jgi:hypothetical protein